MTSTIRETTGLIQRVHVFVYTLTRLTVWCTYYYYRNVRTIPSCGSVIICRREIMTVTPSQVDGHCARALGTRVVPLLINESVVTTDDVGTS